MPRDNISALPLDAKFSVGEIRRRPELLRKCVVYCVQMCILTREGRIAQR